MSAKHRLRKAWLDTTIGLLIVALYAFAPQLASAASSPFGTALSDGQLPGAGWFPELAAHVAAAQFYFNQHITSAVRAVKYDANALWTLIALSFVYGVLHAAGPGHGKAVVSTYILANKHTLRNGVILSFVASMAQSGGAIAIILVSTIVFHVTSVALTRATLQLEYLSDFLIICLGLWLVWAKIIRPALAPKKALAAAVAPASGMPFELVDLDFRSQAGVNSAHSFAPGAPREAFGRFDPRNPFCAECGRLHIPDPSVAAGSLDWRKAWSVVASTALRPCTGALIVLVFSISQHMLWVGIGATLAMGLGTAITVATLATLAVSARQAAALLTTADSVAGKRILRIIEIGGAITVLLFGIFLLAGSILS